MATHGIRQLLKLEISYCPHSGSSKGIRSIITSGDLVSFAEENVDVEVFAYQGRGKHPFVRGSYLTGWDKTIGCKNESPGKIMTQIELLANSSGRKLTKFEKPITTATPSIQGVWTPGLKLVGQDWGGVMKEVKGKV